MVKKEETAAYIIIGAFILFGISLLYGGGGYSEKSHRNKMIRIADRINEQKPNAAEKWREEGRLNPAPKYKGSESQQVTEKHEVTLMQSESQQVVIPKYNIVVIEDSSFGSVKRYGVRVRVGHVLSLNELELVSRIIVDKLKVTKPHNALMLFFYLPDSDTGGLYTAGKAVWAPYGDWARADEVRTGAYSKHSLKLSPGNATGWDPKKLKVPGLSIEKKKRIFFDLVAAQDQGVGDNKAYSIIARKYGVEETTVRKIALEGIARGWPMP